MTGTITAEIICNNIYTINVKTSIHTWLICATKDRLSHRHLM